jgi:hypothetical protein
MNFDMFSRSLISNASSVYTTLQGNLGATQTAQDTIDKLVRKINEEGVPVEERRAGVLSLKALARDWKQVRQKLGIVSSWLRRDLLCTTEVKRDRRRWRWRRIRPREAVVVSSGISPGASACASAEPS